MGGLLLGIAALVLTAALVRELWLFVTARGRAEAELRERDAEVEARAEEARAAPGGSPDRPLVVRSAALVEGRAGDAECAVCGAEVRVADHSVDAAFEPPLRVVTVRCRKCSSERPVYVRVDAPRVH